MTTFETDGYLSDEMPQLEAIVYKKHQGWFDLARDLNVYTRNHVAKYNAHSKDGQETMSVTAFIKILNTFQALVILCRKGMPHESRILLRTMFETTVILKRLCEDEEFFRHYARSSLLYQRRLLKAAKENPHPMFQSTRQLIDQGELVKVEEEIQRLGVTEEQIKERAEKAGMSEFYDSVYRIACDTCHAGPRSLEDYVKVDSEGEINELTSGPFIEVDLELLTSLNFVIIGMESLNKLFKVTHAEEFGKLTDRFVELHKNGS